MTKNEFLNKRIFLLSDLLKINTIDYKLSYDYNSIHGGYQLVIIKNENGGEYSANFKHEKIKYSQFLDYINGMIASIEFLEYYKNYQINK
jgi:hypothetical protein